MLIQKTDLTLEEIVALDRVQKHLPLKEEIIQHLRQEKLIEGRKPHFHVSASIAKATSTQADYIHQRGQDIIHYQKLITDYIEKFHSATRKDIDKLLFSKLSDALTATQKQTKIGYLLTSIKNKGIIQNIGSRKSPIWELQDKSRIKKNKSRINQE